MKALFTKQLKALLLILLLLTNLIVTKAGDNKTTKALLWEISGNGLKKPSYIFGTMHAICPEEFNMPPVVKDSFQKTEQLALEIDMDAPDFMSSIQQGMVLPKGSSLKSMFTAEEYAMLSQFITANMGLPLEHLDMLKPFTLYSMLIPQLTECQPVVFEQKLMEMAQAQKKEVIGVETVQEQIAAIDKLPQQVQVNMLMKTVKELDDAKVTYREMVKLYLDQDLQGLAEISKKEYTAEEYEAYQEALLKSRNKRWIPVMEREAKAKPTFFAVGAGHLPGEDGVLALLRKQGYTVKPVLK